MSGNGKKISPNPPHPGAADKYGSVDFHTCSVSMAAVSPIQAVPGIEPLMKTTICATSFAVVVGLVRVSGSFVTDNNVPMLPIDTRT